jgi:hypothetical protein
MKGRAQPGARRPARLLTAPTILGGPKRGSGPPRLRMTPQGALRNAAAATYRAHGQPPLLNQRFCRGKVRFSALRLFQDQPSFCRSGAALFCRRRPKILSVTQMRLRAAGFADFGTPLAPSGRGRSQEGPFLGRGRIAGRAAAGLAGERLGSGLPLSQPIASRGIAGRRWALMARQAGCRSSPAFRWP